MGSRMSFSAPWTTRSRIAGIDRTRTLPPSFGIACFRFRSGRYVRWTVRPGCCSRKTSTPRLDGLERDPVDTRSPVVLLGQRVGFVERLQLADVDVQAPETPGRFGLRLDVYPPPQVLQIDGRLCHLAPASRVGEGVTDQQGPFAPRALPRLVATADPSATLSPSADFPGSPVIRPTLLRRFRVGARRASPVARMSLSPCRRSHPAGVSRRVSRVAAVHAAFALRLRARPPGLVISGPPLRSLALRPGDSPPSRRMAVSMGFRSSVSLLPAIQATGLRLFPRRD